MATTRSSFVAKRTRKGRGLDVSVCGRMVCQQLKSRVESAARAMVNAILGARLGNTITLKITLRSTEMKTGSGDRVNGAVWATTHESTTNLRAFPITLDASRGFEEMMNTLAHEIQHVEQFRRGRFQLRTWASDRKVHARWEGAELGPVDSIPYSVRPWEIEARNASKKFGGLR